MILWMILLAVNLCIVILYLILCHMKQKEDQLSVWMKACVMLLCPVAGPVFLLAAYTFYRLFLSQAVDLEDVIFSKERVQTVLHPDEETERNMVSIEEALAVTDKANLRNLMLNVVKGDYRNLLSAIALALDGSDSETAHYAASVLQDVLNDFRARVQKEYPKCFLEKDGQAERCLNLIEYMNPLLEQGVLTEMEQRTMVDKMEQLGELLYHMYDVTISSSVFEMISMRLLELKEYPKCRKWCTRAMDQYPMVLSSYTCELKLYFSMNRKEEFFRVMGALRQSNIMVDNETLEMIRTFR